MASVRPIPGKPGHFVDASGRVNVLTEARETDRYDSVQQPAGLITAGATLKFFRDLNNKNEIDSNIPEAGKLVTGSERLLLERIGVSIQASNSTLITSGADYKRLMCAGYLEVKLNRHVIEEGPLEKFPSGYGLSGSTTDNASSIVNVGVPSAAAIKPLAEQQLITDAHTINASVTFQERSWLTTPTMPTTDNQNVIRLYMHGIIEAAATNN